MNTLSNHPVSGAEKAEVWNDIWKIMQRPVENTEKSAKYITTSWLGKKKPNLWISHKVTEQMTEATKTISILRLVFECHCSLPGAFPRCKPRLSPAAQADAGRAVPIYTSRLPQHLPLNPNRQMHIYGTMNFSMAAARRALLLRP